MYATDTKKIEQCHPWKRVLNLVIFNCVEKMY